MNRRAVIGIAIAVALTVAVILGVRAAGSVVRRPEGAAERFLTAASRRSAKDRAKASHFGAPEIAKVFHDFTRKETDHAYLSRIEVGRASGRHGSVRVPFRVHRNDARSTVQTGMFIVEEQPGHDPRPWRVVQLEPCCVGVRRPAHGSAPSAVGAPTWILALGLGLAFTLGSELLLRALGATPRRSGTRTRGQPLDS